MTRELRKGEPLAKDLKPPAGELDASKSYSATFKTSRGDFEVQLYADMAPLTVETVGLPMLVTSGCRCKRSRLRGFSRVTTL